MSNPFDLLASGDLDQLERTLAADPSLAAYRHPSGASLFAWACYVGKPEAMALIRPHLSALDPHDAIIAGEIESVQAHLRAGWDGNTLSLDGFTRWALPPSSGARTFSTCCCR